MQVTFLGATDTVTGSRYLLSAGSQQLLVDCGLFQGYKQLRLRNWEPPPFKPRDIGAVLLTHAHIDHSGYIPLLARRGFVGSVFCTPATLELSRILLPDSGFLQEEQARFANRHSFSKHSPALPLYTEADAEASLQLFRPQPLHREFDPLPGIHARLSSAGHVLGAASVRLLHEGVSITFSGDLGRMNDALMQPPEPPPQTDYLVIESTYGNRQHPDVELESELVDALTAVLERGGVAVVPAFAVGRAQLLLLLIARAKAKQLLPDVPVFLDSPMAVDATELYRIFRSEHRLSEAECRSMCRAAHLVRSVEESKTLSQAPGPKIIISASGMATGGRVVHHLKAFCGDARNLILLTGFQAAGTRGAALASGQRRLRIHGQEFEVRAAVVQLNSASAHADADELIAWMRQLTVPPRRVFVTHGEPAASDALRQRIERELGWSTLVPGYRDCHVLE
ncbi:MAG: MBL fold metallo-hydrolase [Steroidobacteraceae bacterium]